MPPIKLKTRAGLAVSLLLLMSYALFLCALVFAYARHEESQQPQSQRGGRSESFDDLAARAQAARESDRVPEAINLYQGALRRRPDWTEGWWHLGTLLFDSGRFLDARNAFAQFVTTEKQQPGPGFG